MDSKAAEALVNRINDPGLFKTLLDNLHEGVYFVDPERRILYWNKGAERISGFTSEEVTGHSCADNILMHVDERGTALCTTACPLAATLGDCQDRFTRVFLHHKDGHRVPVRVAVAVVRDEQGQVLGGLETFHDDTPVIAALRELEDLKQTALLCPLTGVGNRKMSEDILKRRLAEASSTGSHLAALFVDVDRFKSINDTYGHTVGDVVLKMVAKTLANAVRSYDFVGRWGGEEFIAILPNMRLTDLESFAERMRLLVQSASRTVSRDKLVVTVSVGACLSKAEDTPKSIVERADQLMYLSKTHGRNRVTVGTH